MCGYSAVIPRLKKIQMVEFSNIFTALHYTIALAWRLG